jgi:Domain of unknown function (DUF4262)
LSDHPLLSKIKERIDAYGWAGTSVSPDEKTGTPGFTYTIGLHKTFKHPEIIVFGLNPSASTTLLRRAVGLIKQGRTLPERTPCELMDGLSVVFRHIPAGLQEQYLLSAAFLYGTAFKSLQLVWPDADGRFPWQAGFDSQFAAHQPALYERDN